MTGSVSDKLPPRHSDRFFKGKQDPLCDSYTRSGWADLRSARLRPGIRLAKAMAIFIGVTFVVLARLQLNAQAQATSASKANSLAVLLIGIGCQFSQLLQRFDLFSPTREGFFSIMKSKCDPTYHVGISSAVFFDGINVNTENGQVETCLVLLCQSRSCTNID